MKTNLNFRPAIAAMATIFIVGCTTEPFPDMEVEVVENPHYETIRSMGWSTEDIIERENHYIVEGDILLDKARVDSLSAEPTTRHTQYYNRTLSGGRENGIRIKVSSNNIPDFEWRQAVIGAVQAWNSVPDCNVHFHAIELQILYHDIKVEMDEWSILGSDSPAGAYPPEDGKPQNILINSNFNNLSLGEKTYVMVHELGHTLGLGHTNWGNTDYTFEHITGTPDWLAGQRDYNSVMVSGRASFPEWGSSSLGQFTTGDIAAIQAMYGNPPWSLSIAGPTEYFSGYPTTYTLSLGNNFTNLDVSWYIDNVFQERTSSFNFTLRTPLSQQRATLKATVHYNGTTYQATKVINITHPIISGPSSPRVGDEASYGLPAPLPTGITFRGLWRVSGGNYVATSGLNTTNLKVKFLEAKQYTVTAEYVTSSGGIYGVNKEVVVQPPLSQLTITGPDQPQYLMYPITYSVPATLPSGVTFNGWEVTPDPANGNVWTSSGPLTSPTLNITLKVTAVFTIKANFTLPDGSTFTATKSVSSREATHPLATPVITPNFWRISQGGGGEFHVQNAHPGVSYEWESTGATFTWQNGNMDSSMVTFRHSTYGGSGGGTGFVRCRGHIKSSTGIGQVTAWSQQAVISIAPSPFRIPVDDEEEPEELSEM